MANEQERNQFFSTSAATTPAALDPFPKLADEFKPNVPLKQVFENFDRKVAEWIKKSQNTLAR